MTDKPSKFNRWSERNSAIMCERLESGDPMSVLTYLFKLEELWGTFDYHQRSEVVLRCAIRTKDIGLVRDIFSREKTHGLFDIHPEDEEILTEAIATNDVEMVNYLIGKSDTFGLFRLLKHHVLCAIEMSNKHILELLLTYPASDFDINNDCVEYIELAVSTGKVEIYDIIINNVDVNKIDIHYSEDKILRLAIRSKNIAMIERILTFSGSFDLKNPRILREIKQCTDDKVITYMLEVCDETRTNL